MSSLGLTTQDCRITVGGTYRTSIIKKYRYVSLKDTVFDDDFWKFHAYFSLFFSTSLLTFFKAPFEDPRRTKVEWCREGILEKVQHWLLRVISGAHSKSSKQHRKNFRGIKTPSGHIEHLQLPINIEILLLLRHVASHLIPRSTR